MIGISGWLVSSGVPQQRDPSQSEPQPLSLTYEA